MYIKKLLLVAVACFAFAGAANAVEYFTGSFGAGTLGAGTYSASSLALSSSNFINGNANGTFASLTDTGLTAYAGTLSGLSATPTTENVADYFVFSSAFVNPGNNDDYSFTLTSLTETSPGLFSGAGTLIDSTDTLADTAATFTLSFSGGSPGGYSFSLAAVPDGGYTVLLLGIGFAGLAFFGRRQNRLHMAK